MAHTDVVRETKASPEQLQAFATLQEFLSDPLSGVSPAIQTLLQELIPSEDLARTNLADQFRRAGATGDAAFAVQGRGLERDILTRRGATATKASLQFLGPLLQAQVGAIGALPDSSKTFAPDTSVQDNANILASNAQSAEAARTRQAQFAGSAETNNAAGVLSFAGTQAQLHPSTGFSSGPTLKKALDPSTPPPRAFDQLDRNRLDRRARLDAVPVNRFTINPGF